LSVEGEEEEGKIVNLNLKLSQTFPKPMKHPWKSNHSPVRIATAMVVAIVI
jgi:hypothetical protein